jgi:uncharacterized protein YkwD
MKPSSSLSQLLLISTLILLPLAVELEVPDEESRTAVPALTITQTVDALLGATLLSIPTPPLLQAEGDGNTRKRYGDDERYSDVMTLTITADERPTLLATTSPQTPNPAVSGVIGNINLSKIVGSVSGSFLNDIDFQSSVLNSTNTIRRQHNATALAWNTTLTSYAQNWSQRCRSKKSVSLPHFLT